MGDLCWLADEQVQRLRPFFPGSHGRPRVDDRRVLSGIVFQWRGLRQGMPNRRRRIVATFLKAHRTASSLVEEGR
jgi:hypothetical protein